jgi:hypothetical protein
MAPWHHVKLFGYTCVILAAQLIGYFRVYCKQPQAQAKTSFAEKIKREIAKSIKFEDKSNFEDYAFCMELKKFNLIKTEVEIKEPIYHYRYIDYDKLY